MSDLFDSDAKSRPTLEQAKVGDDQMQYVHEQLAREKSEPSEGFTPVPIFLLFVFSGLIFWGGIYLEKASGNFRWDAYSPDFKVAGPGDGPVVDYESFDWLMARGERIYTQCVACHQVTGAGVAGAFPPLVDSEWVLGNTRILAGILNSGMQGPMTVRGNAYNGVMPSFASLRGRDVAAVLTYIRNSWGNEASPITPSQYESYLTEPELQRSNPWTADELTATFGPVQ